MRNCSRCRLQGGSRGGRVCPPVAGMTSLLGLLAVVVAYCVLVSVTVTVRSDAWVRFLSWSALASFGMFVLDNSAKTSSAELGPQALLQILLPAALVLATILTHPFRLERVSSTSLKYLLLMYVWIFVAVPLALSPFYSLGNTIQAGVVLVVAVRIVTLYSSTSLLLRDMILCASALSISAWLWLGNAFGDLGVLRLSSGSVERLSGTHPYVHPNELAFIAGLSASVLLALILTAPVAWLDRYLRQVPALALLGLLFATTLAAWTRTTVAVTLVTMVVVTLIRFKSFAQRAVIVLVALIGGLVIWSYTSSLVLAFFERGQSTGTLSTLNSRTAWWATAIEEIGISWTGVGVGLGGHRIAGAGLERVGNLDSTWVALLVNAGFVAVALFGLFWASLVVRGLREARTGDRGAVYFAAVFPAFLVTLYNPSVQDLTYIGGFVLAACLALARSDQDHFWLDPSAERGRATGDPHSRSRGGDKKPWGNRNGRSMPNAKQGSVGPLE